MRTSLIAMLLGVCAGLGCGSDADQDKDDMAALVQQGEYLVEHVAACGLCHTPVKADGAPDASKRLSGVMNRIQPMPGVFISAPNLTPDATGLKDWTDADIEKAIRHGLKRDGQPLWPRMPYYESANFTDADTAAVIAYLRSLPPIANSLPANVQYTGRTTPYLPISGDKLPQTTLAASDPKYAAAQRGRYLASTSCVACHTQEAAAGGDYYKDAAKVFAGNYRFGMNLPYTPAVIFSFNLTPHANGIAGLSAAQVQAVLKSGGNTICPPMRYVQVNYFAGMTDADALALGTYFTTLPPVDTGVIEKCTP